MDYHVALYIRLSKEDESEGPSQSVTNQKSLLDEFVKKHRLSVYDTYIDDGWSGTFRKTGCGDLRKVLAWFLQGAAAMLPAVAMIALASSVKLVMVESNIIDTVMNAAVCPFCPGAAFRCFGRLLICKRKEAGNGRMIFSRAQETAHVLLRKKNGRYLTAEYMWE